MKNTKRYDLSSRLIHFFREVDVTSDSYVEFPEFWGFGNIAEGNIYTPLFLLRSAIRHNLIFATWAVRKSKRTIYGPHPAVCFTEMPLAAFLESSKIRSEAGEAMSSYGISFLKNEMFDLGARPVIYGLSVPHSEVESKKPSERIINPIFLPINEQYRYVTYNPTGTYKVDWTHEREWRWPHFASIKKFEDEIDEFGLVSEIRDFPHFDIELIKTSEIGVIVKTSQEAELVLSDILAIHDRKGYSPYKFIFFTDQITSTSKILAPDEEKKELNKSTIDLSKYIIPNLNRDEKILNEFLEIANQVEESFPEIEEGEFGGCWLWVFDSFSEFTRALVNNERIQVNSQNKYLCFPYEFSDSRSLRQREKMTIELSRRLKEHFGIDCGYFSVLNSDDINGLPFYCSQNLGKYKDRFINSSWIKIPNA